MPIEAARILIVDDEPIACANLASILEHEGHVTTQAHSAAEAMNLLNEQDFDVVLTDYFMEPTNGLELLQHIKKVLPGTEVIIVTAYPHVGAAVEAMRAGAYSYLAKPYEVAEARILVLKALEKRLLYLEYTKIKTLFQQRAALPLLLGDSPPMKALKRTISKVAPSDASILILGDTGTGKELVARSIHALSHRANACFIDINCAALSEELLENELFGHEVGAYTGASRLKKGLLESASGGTVFLDELGEMSLGMQVKLLRCVQERHIRRVGGTANIPVDVRIICATNKNLKQEVASGCFRSDLYYRLAVITIHVPSLADRREDIPLLSHYFLEKIMQNTGLGPAALTSEFFTALGQYDFPGNVRELYNIVESATIMSGKGGTILPSHLPQEFAPKQNIHEAGNSSDNLLSLDENEKKHILYVLERTQNNRSHAARILKINRASLWRKLHKYDLSIP